jgi:hypothetical protein
MTVRLVDSVGICAAIDFAFQSAPRGQAREIFCTSFAREKSA